MAGPLLLAHCCCVVADGCDIVNGVLFGTAELKIQKSSKDGSGPVQLSKVYNGAKCRLLSYGFVK